MEDVANDGHPRNLGSRHRIKVSSFLFARTLTHIF